MTVLRQPEFCPHDSGIITWVDGPLCGECHTPMVWVARSALDHAYLTIKVQRAEIARLRGTR